MTEIQCFSSLYKLSLYSVFIGYLLDTEFHSHLIELTPLYSPSFPRPVFQDQDYHRLWFFLRCSLLESCFSAKIHSIHACRITTSKGCTTILTWKDFKMLLNHLLILATSYNPLNLLLLPVCHLLSLRLGPTYSRLT